MPMIGPEVDAAAPPLEDPPTGLLQAATVIQHAMLESPGNLAHAVGPDAPDTVLASAITQIAAGLFPGRVDPIPRGFFNGDVTDFDEQQGRKGAEQQIDALTFMERELLRAELLWRASSTLTAAGRLEAGGPADRADPFSRWLAGLRWSPENGLAPELVDPCGNVPVQKFSAGDGTTGSTGVSRLPNVTAAAFMVQLHDSCSTWGWRANDYVGRATRGLSPKETWDVEREFMHGGFLGASRVFTADAHLTNGSPNVTLADGTFTQADVGKIVTANVSGLAAGTKILTVTDGQTLVLTNSFTGSNTTTAILTVHDLDNAATGNRYLSDSHCHVITGPTDPTPIQALAYLNEYIARANLGQGMIHVSAFFLELVAAGGYAFEKDARGRLRTPNGNIIVPGNGYDGVGPDGTGGSAEDGANDTGHTHEWIYASDLPIIWRPPQMTVFPATLREATKEDQNEVTFRASRPYIIQWSALLQGAIKSKVI